jgi:hypothetical protein
MLGTSAARINCCIIVDLMKSVLQPCFLSLFFSQRIASLQINDKLDIAMLREGSAVI